MRLEDLPDMSSVELCQLDEPALLKHFEHVLKVTRPELVALERRPSYTATAIAKTPQFAAKVAELAKLNIDVSHLLRAKKRK